jgi:hypothetical protein
MKSILTDSPAPMARVFLVLVQFEAASATAPARCIWKASLFTTPRMNADIL